MPLFLQLMSGEGVQYESAAALIMESECEEEPHHHPSRAVLYAPTELIRSCCCMISEQLLVLFSLFYAKRQHGGPAGIRSVEGNCQVAREASEKLMTSGNDKRPKRRRRDGEESVAGDSRDGSKEDGSGEGDAVGLQEEEAGEEEDEAVKEEEEEEEEAVREEEEEEGGRGGGGRGRSTRRRRGRREKKAAQPRLWPR